jgi:integration host factor subunit beta
VDLHEALDIGFFYEYATEVLNVVRTARPRPPCPEHDPRTKSRKNSALQRQGAGEIEMVKSQLVRMISLAHGKWNAGDVEQAVDVFFDTISDQLAQNGRVELRGFGTFSTRTRRPRTARSPTTGTQVDIPEKRAPHFKPAKRIRENLNPKSTDQK